MKIYLIQPPIEDFYSTPLRNIPHGLFSIAATLSGHEISLLDLRFGKSRKIRPPVELTAVTPFYRPDDASPFGLYKAYYRFGLTEAEIRQILPSDGAVYLISSLFTTYADTVYELIRLIRTVAPNAQIIVGGAHATIQPEEILTHGADFVIRGEGEVALPTLLKELEDTRLALAQIPNLSWRGAEGTIYHNRVQYIENLDALPFADYRTPGAPTYYYRDKPLAILVASRGCPYRCAFCCIHQTMGDRYRMRSVENVLAEMTAKVAQGFRNFDFEDDHLGGNRSWFLKLLNGIARRFAGLDLSLQAMNGITAANLDNEILTTMWSAGFRSLNLALVTPSEMRQKQIQRPFGTEKYLQVMETARRLGFFITTYLIIGLPGDRAEDLLKSILFLAPQPTLIGPALFYLTPGTATFQHFAELGQIPASPLCYRSSFYPIENGECDRTAAFTLFRICRILNFMREVIDTECNIRPPDVTNDRIFPGKGISGHDSRIKLGLGLLRLLFEREILYGTGRKRDNYYPIEKEVYNPELIRLFLHTEWRISGTRRSVNLTKSEFFAQYLS